jgi:hypothetical protein
MSSHDVAKSDASLSLLSYGAVAMTLFVILAFLLGVGIMSYRLHHQRIRPVVPAAVSGGHSHVMMGATE